MTVTGVVCSVGSAQTWSVVYLHPADALESVAFAAAGSLQGGAVTTFAGEFHAAVWSSSASSVSSISASSGIIWGMDSLQRVGMLQDRATLWVGSSDTYVNLWPASSSHAYSVWNGWQAGEILDNGYRATLWNGTEASRLDLHPAGARDSHLAALDASGQAGRFRTTFNSPYHAALWHGTAESVVDLHPAGAYASQAQAISSGRQGGFVQFVRDGPSHAALWSGTAESFFDLTPSGGPTVAGAIYGMDGDVQVGQAGFLDGSGGATVWFGTPESAFFLGSLLSADYTETWAYAVDIDKFGTIRVVGYAYNNNYYLPDGTYYPRNEAMMWVLVPEPSSLFALAAGLAGLAGVRPRRRR
jgi:hypothetical protein